MHASLAVLFLICLAPLHASPEIYTLRETFPAGYQYHVTTRVELRGSMTLPTDKDQANRKLAVEGRSAIDYDERVLESSADREVLRTIRIYRKIDLERKVGDKLQESTVRTGVRRLVVLRHKQTEVPFSPDGPLMWNEIDLVRTDVFTPALFGLLPDRAIAIGEKWTAKSAAIQELTDLEKLEKGSIECRFEQVTMVAGRKHARLAFSGTVVGINEDGPNRQQLEGYVFFDLESNHLSYLYLKGVSTLLDKSGNTLGSIEGRFVLTRQAHVKVADLTEEALRGLTLEPNAENTLLFYDNAELGIRFLHPRRWRVAGVRGRQLAIDETGGSGLLMTMEPPGRVPTPAQFLTETRDYLNKEKSRLIRQEGPERLSSSPGEIDRFAFDAEVGGQRTWLDYYTLRYGQYGGATVACRLLPRDLTQVRKEAEKIVRSVVFAR